MKTVSFTPSSTATTVATELTRREAQLIKIAGGGYVIDDESFGCDWCGSRIPHSEMQDPDGTSVDDYGTTDDGAILCWICFKQYEDSEFEEGDDA